jgi:hypothetical protein
VRRRKKKEEEKKDVMLDAFAMMGALAWQATVIIKR